MKRALAVVVVFFATTLTAQQPAPAMESISQADLRADLFFLAGDAMRGRLLVEEGTARLGGIRHEVDSMLYARRILLTACGTSWHAALVGKRHQPGGLALALLADGGDTRGDLSALVAEAKRDMG